MIDNHIFTVLRVFQIVYLDILFDIWKKLTIFILKLNKVFCQKLNFFF